MLQKQQQESSKKGVCYKICDYFSEYCINASINGVKYIGEKGVTVIERIFWTFFIAVSIYFSIYLISKTYNKWQVNPVIVSFAESPTPVWQIPFPAVTVCSETKARRSVFNFTDYYHKIVGKEGNVTDEEQEKFETISLLCDNHLYKEGANTINTDVFKIFEKVAPQFEEMFFACKWKNTNASCTDLFTKMVTEEGVCYTFNMLDAKEFFTKSFTSGGRSSNGWNLENGYPVNSGLDTYPHRALGSGLRAGLTLLLRSYDYDLDYVCRGPVQGFKVVLHHPAEVARVSQQFYRIPLEQEVIIAIKPDMMTTSEGVRDYAPHRRNCYFPSERRLKYYKTYTQQNCETECLTNFTLETCGCVAYHMPRDTDTPICGSGKTHCVGSAQGKLLEKEVTSEITSVGYRNQNCDCLPACTSLKYGGETSQSDFNWRKVFESFRFNVTEFPGIRLSRVNLLFKEGQFITSRRSELYGIVDFLANCGGLLGLFMGFSFLSLVEIVYFLTLRMWCNISTRGKQMKMNVVPLKPSAPPLTE